MTEKGKWDGFTMQDFLNIAWDKKHGGRLGELTDFEAGVLCGYEDGFAAGLGEEEPWGWPHPADDGLPYRYAYKQGLVIGGMGS